jgi:hypothetical protein
MGFGQGCSHCLLDVDMLASVNRRHSMREMRRNRGNHEYQIELDFG